MIYLNTSVIFVIAFFGNYVDSKPCIIQLFPSCQFKGFEKLTYMTLLKLNESFTRIGGLYQSGFLIKTSKDCD